jgi:hypothetical protein
MVSSNLYVALIQCCLSEATPNLRLVEGSRHFKRNIKVAALDGQVESSGLFLNEVKCNLENTTCQFHQLTLKSSLPPGNLSAEDMK